MASGIIRVPIPESTLRRALGDKRVEEAYRAAHDDGEHQDRAVEVYVGAHLTRAVMDKLEDRVV